MTKKLLIIFLFFSSNLLSAQFASQQVFNSLNVPGSARIGALGGTYMPVQDSDLDLGIFNPSVLDSSMHNQMSLSYVNYFSNVNLGYAAFAKHIDNVATFAASLRYMSYGQFDGYDASGFSTGNFSGGDYYLTLGAGIKVDEKWRVGMNLKFIYSVLDRYNSFGVATDYSATYNNPERRFTAVWILKNVGMQLNQFDNEDRSPLPTELQFGISKKLLNAPFRFSVMGENLQKWDLTYDNPNETVTIDPITGDVVGQQKFEFGDKLMRHINLGGEILFTDNFHFRFGYNYRRRQEMKINSKPGIAGMSLGVGIQVKKFKISYARSTYHISGSSNHFSIGRTIGG